MRIQTLICASAAAVLLAACANSGEKRAGVLPPYAQQDRITDQAIRADFESMEALQARLALLNRNGQVPTSNYHWAKAQCWLDMGRHNYHENDRSGTVESALGQSESLIKGLEAKATLAADTPLIPESVKLRDDLWNKAAAYKGHPQFACVASQVACYEVQLVWMGQEYKEGGWRHANPYIGIAEQMGAKIERDLAACAPPPAPVLTAAPVPAPKPVVVPVVERFALAADALFAFDKSSLEQMLPEGRRSLDEFAARVKQLSRVDRISLTGYTDRLGTREYNAALSRARAETVKDYLVAQGVAAAVIQFEGRGSANPVVMCGDQALPALKACLQPNRRVEVDLAGAVLR